MIWLDFPENTHDRNGKYSILCGDIKAMAFATWMMKYSYSLYYSVSQIDLTASKMLTKKRSIGSKLLFRRYSENYKTKNVLKAHKR